MYIPSTFTDLPSPVDLKTVSTICVTFFNISWNASNGITCGDISYEVLVYQSSIGQSMKEITRIGDVFYSSVTGLNNSDPDVMVTVTASNRAGQGNMSISVRLPPSLGKCYVCMCTVRICTHVNILYSGYNLRSTIFANHQISRLRLAIIFAIIKFADHCMYRITFCMAYVPAAYRYCYPVHCCNTCHGAVDSFTVESFITG